MSEESYETRKKVLKACRQAHLAIPKRHVQEYIVVAMAAVVYQDSGKTELGKFRVDGHHLLCAAAYRFIHGFTRNTWYNALNECKKAVNSHGTHSVLAAVNGDEGGGCALQRPVTTTARGWIEAQLDLVADGADPTTGHPHSCLDIAQSRQPPPILVMSSTAFGMQACA